MAIEVAENGRPNLIKRSTKRKEAQKKIRTAVYLFFDNVNTFYFSVTSVSRIKTSHTVKVQIPNLFSLIEKYIESEDVLKSNFLFENFVVELLNENLKVYCDCEDFLYSGTKYYCYHNDAGIEPEDRKPQPDKEKRRSLLCKHLRFILVYIKRFSRAMARDLKKAVLAKNKD